MIDSEPAGCAAFRRFDSTRSEAKRFYVRPRYRGLGLGSALLDWIIAGSRAAGYIELVADTMPVMTGALAMYERRGFARTAPYAADPTPGAIYLRFSLT